MERDNQQNSVNSKGTSPSRKGSSSKTRKNPKLSALLSSRPIKPRTFRKGKIPEIPSSPEPEKVSGSD